MSDNLAAVTESTFDSLIFKSDKPALVDFWARWGAPCKAITPVIEEMAESYGDKVKFVKMNVDENPSTPGKYGVRGIPTLILFKDGEVVDQVVGAVPKNQIKDLVDKGL